MTIVTKTALATDPQPIAAPIPALRRPADVSYISTAPTAAFASARPAGLAEGEPNELDAAASSTPFSTHNAKIYWLYMRPEGRPIITFGLLSDVKTALDHLAQLFAEQTPRRPPARYTVMASRMPGIFNLGGDLRNFADLIRDKDRAMLEQYGRPASRRNTIARSR